MSIPIEVARWLVERGANVNAVNRYGTTLREQAGMRYPNIDICKLLIDNGADPYHRNWKLEDYNTPLGYMIERLEPHDVEFFSDARFCIPIDILKLRKGDVIACRIAGTKMECDCGDEHLSNMIGQSEEYTYGLGN